jgi:hypothetical protein
MPLPTRDQITKIFYECIALSAKAEEMDFMFKSNTGEVAMAYKTLQNEAEFKLRKKLNDLWLYTNDSDVKL